MPKYPFVVANQEKRLPKDRVSTRFNFGPDFRKDEYFARGGL